MHCHSQSVSSQNPTDYSRFLPFAPGQGWEEHAQGDDSDAQGGGHLQAPGAAVLCAGNNDCLGLQRLQVCTSQFRMQWDSLFHSDSLKEEHVWSEKRSLFH